MRKLLPPILTIVALALILFGFQNCGKMTSTITPGSSITDIEKIEQQQLIASGNGSGTGLGNPVNTEALRMVNWVFTPKPEIDPIKIKMCLKNVQFHYFGFYDITTLNSPTYDITQDNTDFTSYRAHVSLPKTVELTEENQYIMELPNPLPTGIVYGATVHPLLSIEARLFRQNCGFDGNLEITNEHGTFSSWRFQRFSQPYCSPLELDGENEINFDFQKVYDSVANVKSNQELDDALRLSWLWGSPKFDMGCIQRHLNHRSSSRQSLSN